MPYSLPIFDDVCHHLIKNISIARCLDIGVGAGKYGNLVRRYHPRAHLVGIEVDQDYIDQYKLSEFYNDIRCMHADRLIKEDLEENYDLVILGDCLEHMRKSDGIDLLNFLVYRTHYLLIIYPEGFIQGCWQGHRHEAHISFWTEIDFSGMDYILLRRFNTVLVAVNGYLLRRVAISVQDLLNSYNGNTLED